MQHGSTPSSQAHFVVGRAAEVGYLEQCLETALNGERQVVFVSGEPGIGKTTIVNAFLQRLIGAGNREVGSSPHPSQSPNPHSPLPILISHGQCIEQYGAGEAYLPLLEAGTRLCQGPEGEQAIALLRQYAPTWLVQLPGVISDAEWEQIQRRVQSSTRERMLREAAEVMARFTQERGYVLVLEDLHWSDVSTLEWLSYIAQRQEAAKLLIIGTYRPQDVLISGHPLRGVVQDLLTRNRCEELRVAPLSEQSVNEYLSSRFSHSIAASTLPGLIHRRTGGNPLFMVNIADYLTAQQVLQQHDAEWRVHGDVNVVADSVPQSLQHLIERQLERLPEDTQYMLEVASVVGMEFSAAEVASGLQITVETIEAQCDDLVRKDQFLRRLGTEEWPDGTLGERYSFLHALYRDVLYRRLAETRRVRLHRRIGERKEAAYGTRASEIATELATHFEAGRDVKRAVHHLQRAGKNALHRYANQEAIGHLTKGLGFLKTLPDSRESCQQELSLQMALGPALIATKGYTAPEVEQAYLRARELSEQLADQAVLFRALYGLWSCYITRAEHGPTRTLAGQMLALAQHPEDSALLLQAHRVLAETCFVVGEFALAREHGIRGRSLYDARHHRAHALLYAEEPGVFCHALTSWALWNLGYPDQALQESFAALSLAQEAGHPFSLGLALMSVTMVCQMCGDAPAVRERAQEGIAFTAAQGFPFWEPQGAMLHGWALAQLDQGEEGIAQIRHALEVYPAVEFRPWYIALLVEAYERAGRIDEGLSVVADALELVRATGECFHEAELYRLKGELTLAQSGVRSPASEVSKSQILNPKSQEEAEEYFWKAIEIARKQQAKSVELRAVMSLARLWQQQGKRDEARQLLQEIYDWFTEGFDTTDLQKAEALLTALGSKVERAACNKQEGTNQKAKGKNQKAKVTDPRPLIPDPFFSSTQPLAPNTFRNEGDYWTVTFAERTCHIRDTLGMRYLAQLLTHPHEEIHVLALAAEEPVLAPSSLTGKLHPEAMQTGSTDAGEVLDPQAKAAYRQRLRDLQEELAEAQAFNDPGRIEKLQDEIEFLTQELAQAVGLGGRTRKAASVAERARVNVTKRIKIALRKISEQHPTLSEHLTQTIHTGTFCGYIPSPPSASDVAELTSTDQRNTTRRHSGESRNPGVGHWIPGSRSPLLACPE